MEDNLTSVDPLSIQLTDPGWSPRSVHNIGQTFANEEELIRLDFIAFLFHPILIINMTMVQDAAKG